jgi:hypothetical protein
MGSGDTATHALETSMATMPSEELVAIADEDPLEVILACRC